MLKSDFLKKIDDLGLSVASFAEKTGLSSGSVYNWNDDKKPVPSWVKSWLENYDKSNRYEKIKEIINDTENLDTDSSDNNTLN
ncbi:MULTISPECIES: hypothetical protein [unclassified Campylobacter]|uniref:hypothetical protein n=1 Tax=unclassified Campylobacter TaxID=2593542 RepID=UPI003D354E74